MDAYASMLLLLGNTWICNVFANSLDQCALLYLGIVCFLLFVIEILPFDEDFISLR